MTYCSHKYGNRINKPNSFLRTHLQIAKKDKKDHASLHLEARERVGDGSGRNKENEMKRVKRHL